MATPADMLPDAPHLEPELAEGEQDDGDEDEDDDPRLKYWAAEEDPKKVIAELKNHERRYFEAVQVGGFGTVWAAAYCAFYGLDPDSMEWDTQAIRFDGEEGELLRFRVNDARSFLQQMDSMVLSQRPYFQAQAESTDYDTLSQIEASDAAVNAVFWTKYGERKRRKTVKLGSLFGLAWTWVQFDADGGELIDVPLPLPDGTPSPVKQRVQAGDIVIRSLGPWQVFCDPYIDEAEDHLWRCVRYRRNKYQLAAEVKDRRAREEILSMAGDAGDDSGGPMSFGLNLDSLSDDEVMVKYFYHQRCTAMPNGRYLVFVGDTLVYDGSLPGKSIPLVDFCPSEYIGTAFGYSEFWDLMPLNLMLDQIVSDIATNVAAFGRPTIYTEEGVDWDIQDLMDGQRVLTGKEGQPPPVPISVAAMPEGATWLVGYIEKKFQGISGLNAVVRGQSPENVKSGVHAALMHSLALEINEPRQAAVDHHDVRCANLLLEVLQSNLEYPWELDVGEGQDDRVASMRVEKHHFAGIRRITMRNANPILKTQAGRLEVGKLMVEMGAIKDPSQLLEVLVSGVLKPAYQSSRWAALRITWENEKLSEGPPIAQKPDADNPIKLDPKTLQPMLDPMTGQPVPNMVDYVPILPVLPTDNPAKHVSEHSVSLGRAVQQAVERGTDPRSDPVVVASLAHINEHLREWKGEDPAMLALVGVPTPPGVGDTVGGPITPENDEEGAPEGKIPPVRDMNRDTTGVRLPKPAQSPIGAEAAE